MMYLITCLFILLSHLNCYFVSHRASKVAAPNIVIVWTVISVAMSVERSNLFPSLAAWNGLLGLNLDSAWRAYLPTAFTSNSSAKVITDVDRWPFKHVNIPVFVNLGLKMLSLLTRESITILEASFSPKEILAPNYVTWPLAPYFTSLEIKPSLWSLQWPLAARAIPSLHSSGRRLE